MMPFSYTSSHPREPYPDQAFPPQDSASEHHSRQSFYRPSGQGDVFLFSPSLCSRISKESASQSSGSFDTLSYSYSPTVDLCSAPKPLSPSSFVISSRSPAFVEAYLSGLESKPVAQLSPSTPWHECFNSSPAGYWQAGNLSVSPISRHSSVPAESTVDCQEEGEVDEDEVSCDRLESLLDYEKSQSIADSPACRPSSPSSLSSLSSIASSPSALLSGLLAPSSQTSRSRTPYFSPRASAPSRLLSPLGSPIKLSSILSSGSGAPSSLRRRSSHSSVPRFRPVKRSLAADILNELGRPRGNYAFPDGGTSSAFVRAKIASSPASAIADSDDGDENYEPHPSVCHKTRKRTRAPVQDSPSSRGKRLRTSKAAPEIAVAATGREVRGTSEVEADEDKDGSTSTYPNRMFPLRIPIHESFPLFYRKFPVCSVVDAEVAATSRIVVPKVPEATANAPRDVFDLYTPRFVKGKGTSKVGLCPICHESVARGGEGKKLWLSMKFSAFNYHMQYAHGISATSGLPFSPPIAFRTTFRPHAGKHEKTQLLEGRCHKCKKWVPVEGVKDVPSKVKEIFWWKHAAGCHQGSVIEGEGDVFVEDAVWQAVTREDAEVEEVSDVDGEDGDEADDGSVGEEDEAEDEDGCEDEEED